MMTLSLLGSQKHLNMRSIASSLPFPKKIRSESMRFKTPIFFFNSVCDGSGYLLYGLEIYGLVSGEPKLFSFAFKKIPSVPVNSARADEYGSNALIFSLTSVAMSICIVHSENLIRTAFPWASRPSASAIDVIASAMLLRPLFVIF